MRLSLNALSSKQGLSKNIIVGFAALASAAVVGTVGMAGAMNNPDDNQQRKEFCKNWKEHGFKNHGKCVSDWNSKKHSYPGPKPPKQTAGHHIHTAIKVDGDNHVNGNNNNTNIFVQVFNYIFG